MVGWSRIVITLLSGAALVALMWMRALPGLGPLLWAVLALCVLLALWQWMRLWTRFVVDDRGVTVSLGGFWPQRTWEVHDFRSVQLREVPASELGTTVGGVGWRRGMVFTPQADDLTAVGKGRIRTSDQPQERYRTLATKAGTMVEIIGREGVNYLLSPEDPQATAAAVDQAIRARR